MSAILIDAFARADETGTLEVDGERWVIVRVPYAGDIRAAVLEHLRASVVTGLAAGKGPAALRPYLENPETASYQSVSFAPRRPRDELEARRQAAEMAGASPLSLEADDEYVQPDAAPAVDWNAALEDDGG